MNRPRYAPPTEPVSRHPGHVPAMILGLLLLLGLPTLGSAQGVRYVQRSEMEMGGPMAAMMSSMNRDAASESRTTVLGARMRTDTDGQSTIVDMETGSMILLNHEARTFVPTSLEDMAAQMAQIQAQAQAEVEGSGASMEMEEPEIMEMDETRSIQGYDAQRTVMVMRMSALMPSMGGMEGMPGMPGGQGSEVTSVMVNDMWLAPDVPGAEVTSEMAQRWRETISRSFQGMGGGMMAGIAAGTDLVGIPLRTVSSTVLVPQGQELDLEAVLEGADEPLADGGGGLGAMARAMMGGGGGADGQMVFMRVVTEVTEIEEMEVDPSIFEVPAGYTETTLAETLRR